MSDRLTPIVLVFFAVYAPTVVLAQQSQPQDPSIQNRDWPLLDASPAAGFHLAQVPVVNHVEPIIEPESIIEAPVVNQVQPIIESESMIESSVGYAPVTQPIPQGDDVSCASDASAPSYFSAGYCCPKPWAHRSGLFGEYLYMRARGVSVPYAVSSAAGAVVVPLQPVATADADYQSAFRAGLSCALNDCSSFVCTYTKFESSSQDNVTTAGTLRSLVMHPGVVNAGLNFLDGAANIDVDMDLIDLDFRSTLVSGKHSALNYLVGARYAEMNQQFRSLFTGGGTTDAVLSDVDFTGLGLRLGLDGERHGKCNGFLLYGRGVANLMAGEFRNRYFHPRSPAVSRLFLRQPHHQRSQHRNHRANPACSLRHSPQALHPANPARSHR